MHEYIEEDLIVEEGLLGFEASLLGEPENAIFHLVEENSSKTKDKISGAE